MAFPRRALRGVLRGLVREGRGNRMANVAGVALRKAETGASCDRCGLTDDPGQLVISLNPPPYTGAPQVQELTLCVWCTAELLGLQTGFKTRQQLEQWYRMRVAVAAAHRAPGRRAEYNQQVKRAASEDKPAGENGSQGE